MRLKKILFFANGDPRNATTWSNVPCCFVKELEQRGIEVVTFDLSSHPFITKIYDLILRRIFKLLLMPFGITPVWFSNSWLYKRWGYKKIKRVVEENIDADYCFFINYLFYNKFNQIPSLLLGDWPQFVHLRNEGNSPLFKRVFAQEKFAIENAKYVISIFQVRAEEMQAKYQKANILFLGGNVVNNLCPWKIENGYVEVQNIGLRKIVDIKKQSNSILFIGKPDRYKESAIKVIEAFKKLRKNNHELELNIIGISENDLKEKVDGVHCYGFLHKDINTECEMYYRLLIEAKVIVNPNPKWAAYSSMIEAMYFYTPVVVSPYDAFVDEFGKTIDFGIYNDSFTVKDVVHNIQQILAAPNFKQLCQAAHEKVKDYSWTNYVDKLLCLE